MNGTIRHAKSHKKQFKATKEADFRYATLLILRNMEDNIDILENERQPQYFSNGR